MKTSPAARFHEPPTAPRLSPRRLRGSSESLSSQQQMKPLEHEIGVPSGSRVVGPEWIVTHVDLERLLEDGQQCRARLGAFRSSYRHAAEREPRRLCARKHVERARVRAPCFVVLAEGLQ